MNKFQVSDVAIIIVNWNGYKDTFDCLKSLESLKYSNFHVFLVDNCSEDDSFERLTCDFENKVFNLNLSLLRTEKNLGFAGGNNVAIKRAYEKGYKYFWLLNNDTEVDSYALSRLVESVTENSNIGIVGSKIYYYGTNIIWFAGGKINTWTGDTKHIGYKEKDIGQYDDKSIYIDYVTGCSLLFRREVLDSIGYMDERYFLYYEETDWNIRAKQFGWEIKVNSNSIVYHKVSMSSGGENNRAPYVVYFDIRNAFRMINKTQGIHKKLTSYFYMYYKSLKQILKMIIKKQDRKMDRILFILKALRDSHLF